VTQRRPGGDDLGDHREQGASGKEVDEQDECRDGGTKRRRREVTSDDLAATISGTIANTELLARRSMSKSNVGTGERRDEEER
jgi:hypothetical protein